MMRDKFNRLKKLEDILSSAEKKFPDIFISAVNVVREKNVKKYIFKPSGKILWIVVGRENEYVISEITGKNIQFVCSCPDYLFRVLLKKGKETPTVNRNFCYHILARILSEVHEIKKLLGIAYKEKYLPQYIYTEDEYLFELIRELLA